MIKNAYLGWALAFIAFISPPLLAEDTSPPEPQADISAPNTEREYTAALHRQLVESHKVMTKHHNVRMVTCKSARHCNWHKNYNGKIELHRDRKLGLSHKKHKH